MYETDADRRTLGVSIVAALVLTAVSLVLGYAGYRTTGLSPLDSFFGTLQLFALDADRDLPDAPLPIGVARFTAPLALVMASVVAVIALVGQTVRHSARLRRIKQHVVVLGLSDNSTEFTNALLEQGHPVVVVEVDGEHPGLPAMRRSGALLVVGDASREATQRLAHVERSSRVVVSTGDDGRNLRSAETAARLLEDSRETTVHVLLEDYWLHEELARTEFMTSGTRGPEIDFVHRADYEAAAFIEAVTTASQASLTSDAIVFEGSGERGRRTLIHLARRNLLLDVQATIRVDDETHRSVVEPELTASPWLAQVVGRRQPGDSGPGACLVAVAAPDGAVLGRGMQLALTHPHSEVFVLTDFPVGQSLLPSERRDRGDPRRLDRPQPVEPLRELVGRHPGARPTPDLLRAGGATGRRSGDQPVDHPVGGVARCPEGVEPRLRPCDLAACSRAFHCGWRHSGGSLGGSSPFPGELMEQLARNEHDRWAGDLVRKGWRWGPPPKDPENRTHPLLVGWEELAEDEREKDRDSIRSIPTMLALVGLELQSD